MNTHVRPGTTFDIWPLIGLIILVCLLYLIVAAVLVSESNG